MLTNLVIINSPCALGCYQQWSPIQYWFNSCIIKHKHRWSFPRTTMCSKLTTAIQYADSIVTGCWSLLSGLVPLLVFVGKTGPTCEAVAPETGQVLWSWHGCGSRDPVPCEHPRKWPNSSLVGMFAYPFFRCLVVTHSRIVRTDKHYEMTQRELASCECHQLQRLLVVASSWTNGQQCLIVFDNSHLSSTSACGIITYQIQSDLVATNNNRNNMCWCDDQWTIKDDSSWFLLVMLGC